VKILTGAQMNAVDQRAAALGIASMVLMENAGCRVVDFLALRFAPLARHRIVIFCGKGNNGGDGLVVARQLLTRFAPESLDVVLAEPAEQMKGEAAAQLAHWFHLGQRVQYDVTPECHAATIVVDALLGTGLEGPPRGRYAEFITMINEGFPAAHVIAVDVPSGIGRQGVWAEATVTFEAPKVDLFGPAAASVGELVISPIGLPAALIEQPGHWLALNTPGEFRGLFAPRLRTAHKGDFGHVLVVGGAAGTTGAAAMTGLAALRAGAGLVTVCASTQQGFPPELMTAPLSDEALQGKSVLAIGPGLGNTPDTAALVSRLVTTAHAPLVLDADALNVLGSTPVRGCILTPHPGEMARLTGVPTAQIQANRIPAARQYAQQQQATLVLKGAETVIAAPDGSVWLNTTGNPGMATGGSGDVLTGLLAGLLAQTPSQAVAAVLAAVWLHGRAADLAVAELGEKPLIATDILRFIPAAMREIV
jgi:ADP-dependent NAD(P)H-hydrate dehydratase / NAD(P)H-hydrate epimerase